MKFKNLRLYILAWEKRVILCHPYLPERKGWVFQNDSKLQKPNKHVEYEHFEMETLQSVLNIIRSNCWMATMDLKDAFHTMPIHSDHQKLLKFRWQEHWYTFRIIPNGYSKAMRVFTKGSLKKYVRWGQGGRNHRKANKNEQGDGGGS